MESELCTVAELSFSLRVLDSFGFAIFEFMESLGRHDDIEATVANVLQVGEPSTLVVGDEPPVLADVVLAENVVIDFGRLFSLRDDAGHVPPVAVTQVRQCHLLNESFH